MKALFLGAALLAMPALAAVSYQDAGSIAADSGFQARVDEALLVAAIAIYNEAPDTPRHTARVLYAQKVIVGTYDRYRVSLAVLSTTAVAAEASAGAGTPLFGVPDPDVQNAVNAIWNALAGA